MWHGINDFEDIKLLTIAACAALLLLREFAKFARSYVR